MGQKVHVAIADNEIKKYLETIRSDLVNIKAAADALATKLNNDATVTDTDYAGPPALNLEQ